MTLTFDLLLGVFALPSLYWGIFRLRGRHPKYAAAMLAAGASCLIALALRHVGSGEGRQGDLLGWVGIVAASCLLLVGPLLRRLAHRAAALGRPRLASRLLEVAVVLMPGAGVSKDRAALEALADVSAGRVDATIAQLRNLRGRLPPEAHRELDERIALLLVSAHRWQEAVDYVDANLPTNPPTDPSTGEPPAETSADWQGIRQRLGMSAPLWVEIMGACARLANLTRTATMLVELERACEGRADAHWILHRGRLVLLAFAGRTEGVKQLLFGPSGRHMAHAARQYWLGIVTGRAGDVVAARDLLVAARQRSRGQPRSLCDAALADLSAPVAVIAPEVAAIADSLVQAPLPAPQAPARRRVAATSVLVAANVAVAGFVGLTWGSSHDVGVLARAGAAVRTAVEVGEWWRLVTATFLHVGVLHLALNMVSLWSLGRWTETLYGRMPTVLVYGLGGVGGAVASYMLGSAGVSAGASGGVMAVIGALLVELWVRRTTYHHAWRSGLAGNLVVVTVAQVGLGFVVPSVDQWAHLAGMAVGISVGSILSPQSRTGSHLGTRIFGNVVTVAWAAAVVFAMVMVAVTPYAATLQRTGTYVAEIADVTMRVPRSWDRDRDELVDPDLFIVVSVDRIDTESPSSHDQRFTAWVRGEAERARRRGFSSSDREAEIVPPTTGWDVAELVAHADGGLGGTQRYRAVTFGRDEGESSLMVTVYAPDALWPSLVPTVREMLASLRSSGPTPDPAHAPAQ